MEKAGEKADLRLSPGETFHVDPGTRHRMYADESDCLVVEVSTPELDDVVRLADRYGREGTSHAMNRTTRALISFGAALAPPWRPGPRRTPRCPALTPEPTPASASSLTPVPTPAAPVLSGGKPRTSGTRALARGRREALQGSAQGSTPEEIPRYDHEREPEKGRRADADASEGRRVGEEPPRRRRLPGKGTSSAAPPRDHTVRPDATTTGAAKTTGGASWISSEGGRRDGRVARARDLETKVEAARE